MTTLEIRTKISLAELLNSLKQLDVDELSEVASTAVRLRANSRKQVLPKHETILLQQINSTLIPVDQARMDVLIEKRQAEMLTEAELTELIALSDHVEEIQTKRLSALIELAAIRDVSLENLKESLNSQTV
ncbi:MAG: hypothetical protein GWP17_04150 [Aquificales bacterium]|nr:hypothetical protein [Aquificales bacterium]